MKEHPAPPPYLGLGILAGLMTGAAAGAIAGAIPVGVAAGLGVGALVDWLRYHPKPGELHTTRTDEETKQ